ncbi:MAG: hypothetical protein ACI9WU_002225 [Myxococcota bacterium]|jgi:hypothetical protein
MPELIVMLKNREISRFPILRVQTKIGRDETMDVIIDNVGVSRHHASLTYDGQGFVVSDESSQNGIFVNGNRSRQAAVSNGDVIGIGKFSVMFSSSGGVPSAKLMRDSPLAGWADDVAAEQNNPLETMALTSDELSRMVDQLAASRDQPKTHTRARSTLGAPSIQIGLQLNQPGARATDTSGRLPTAAIAERQRLHKRRREQRTLKVINIGLAVVLVLMLGVMGWLLWASN